MKEQPIVKRTKELLKSKGIELANFNIPLGTGEDCGCIADILEESVDERYYINPKRYEHLKVNDESDKNIHA